MRPDSRSPPAVGISSCLLGESVRYNGEHRRAPVLLAVLTPRVRWVPVCPEVEVGMGVPREPVRVVDLDRAGERALLGVDSGRDWTRDIEEFAASCTARLEALGLSGHVFKSRSPSCGLRDVPVHSPKRGGERSETTLEAGLFAAAVRARFPDLPIADELELADERACHAFLERVLRYEGRR